MSDRAAFYSEKMRRGFMSINQARKLEGLPVLDSSGCHKRPSFWARLLRWLGLWK